MGPSCRRCGKGWMTVTEEPGSWVFSPCTCSEGPLLMGMPDDPPKKKPVKPNGLGPIRLNMSMLKPRR